MGMNERVDSYYGEMQDNLQRMASHEIPNDFITSIFIGGLYPMQSRIYVKKGVGATYAQAYAQVERLENELVIYTDNMYSNNLIPSHSALSPLLITINIITDAPVVQNSNAPLYTQPLVSRTTEQDIVIPKLD